MKKLITVFQDLEEVHIYKDVGMIPACASEISNKKSDIYYKKQNGKEISDKKEITLKPIVANNSLTFYMRTLIGIIKDKTENKLVNVYHMNKLTVIFVIVLRLLGIKSFVKLDMDSRAVKYISEQFSNKTIRSHVIRLYIRMANIITVEQSQIKETLKEIDPVFEKVDLLPNCIYKNYAPKVSNELINYSERENIILVVGRIGAFQKNHEVIFDTIKDRKLNGWKICFAGQLSEDMSPKYIELLNNHPNFEYLGNLDRQGLFKKYSEAKVFLMTSRWEGFSLALLEAAYMGLYIITTDVGGAREVTYNGKYGEIIENVNDVGFLIEEITKGNIDLEMDYDRRLNYIRKEFDMEDKLKNIVK